MKKHSITNQKQLRSAFWETFPELSRKWSRKHYVVHGSLLYPADTRMAFVDWIDSLQKSDQISEKLAERATL